MGRALADAKRNVRGFSDPFALKLLPVDCREAVTRRIQGERPRNRREAALGMVATVTSRIMGPRTVTIDDGLRQLPPGYQLVIVGAGLDARAYRMDELSQSIVFELDHPATQAFKRRQAAGLVTRAKELRYVPIDFTQEQLGDALERAGHSTAIPTAWIFEGVISYLTPGEVATSLRAMAKRSAPGSRLLATYNEDSAVRRVFSTLTSRTREPHRAWFSPTQMQALLEREGFRLHSDFDGLARARRCGVKPFWLEYLWVRSHHVVIADVAAP
jgi:methyltransferase (TIGR00027 family)